MEDLTSDLFGVGRLRDSCGRLRDTRVQYQLTVRLHNGELGSASTRGRAEASRPHRLLPLGPLVDVLLELQDGSPVAVYPD
jgi:hypothetical protein